MSAPALIFYDGGCGLCHAAVRFCLARDLDGSRFRYAPLGGAAWRALYPAERAPASTFVLHREGRAPLTRSEASLEVLRGLGGAWGALGAGLRCVPRGLRDGVYDLVARLRRRLFRAPSGACPVLRPELRARFDLES